MTYNQIIKRLIIIGNDINTAKSLEDGDWLADLIVEQGELEAAANDIESQMEDVLFEDTEYGY